MSREFLYALRTSSILTCLVSEVGSETMKVRVCVFESQMMAHKNADAPHILAVMDRLAVVASKLNTFSLKTIPIRVIEFSCNATITKFVEALG